MKKRAPRRDPHRRGSRTQAERLASLRWNIKDAAEALRNAVDLQNWDGVIKYAKQIQALERKIATSSQLGGRRRFDPRQPAWMNRMTTAQYEAAERARRRGRAGVP